MASLAAFADWSPMTEWLSKIATAATADLVKDENFWAEVRKGYKLKTNYINFENGYYCFLPEEILERHIENLRHINFQGAHYMRTKADDDKVLIVNRLSELMGCKSSELVITRNTTESLDLVIQGLDWKPGDEAVMAEQDYGSMLEMFELVGNRFGIVNRKVSVPLHPDSDEEIVELYARAITPKTRMLMVSHIINITGQILPVRKIADMARSRGVLTLVDGAHAIGHFRFRMDELNCDFYGSSLHKWLSVPLGTGLLYVKEGNAPLLWPLLAGWNKDRNDVNRLGHTGTRPVGTLLSIGAAIDFYKALGPELKEARLRFLQRSLTERLSGLPHIVLNTPEAPERACAIANIGVRSMAPVSLADDLLKTHGIYTVAIDVAGVHGCRFTPNIYTSLADVEALVNALKSYA